MLCRTSSGHAQFIHIFILCHASFLLRMRSWRTWHVTRPFQDDIIPNIMGVVIAEQIACGRVNCLRMCICAVEKTHVISFSYESGATKTEQELGQVKLVSRLCEDKTKTEQELGQVKLVSRLCEDKTKTEQ